MRNFAHATEFLTLGKALLILLPLYLLMLIMQILTQTDNNKCRKSVVTIKSIIFKKMSLKFRNPKFNIFCKITFIFYIKCQPFRVHR